MVHLMIQAGVGHELIEDGLDVVRDELHHAAMSQQTLVAFGGGPELPSIPADTLDLPIRDEGILASLLDALVRNACLGETLAVPLFRAMAGSTTHPSAREVIEQILKDEARHSAFGWAVLDALIDSHEGVVEWVASQLPAHAEAFRRAYAGSTADANLSDAERAAGLMSPVDYHRVFWVTWSDTIAPKFEKRGIRTPSLSPS